MSDKVQPVVSDVCSDVQQVISDRCNDEQIVFSNSCKDEGINMSVFREVSINLKPPDSNFLKNQKPPDSNFLQELSNMITVINQKFQLIEKYMKTNIINQLNTKTSRD